LKRRGFFFHNSCTIVAHLVLQIVIDVKLMNWPLCRSEAH